jgi:hypothetical protein
MVNGIYKKRTLGKSLLLSLGLLFCFVTPAYALDVTLQWDANTEPDLDGYKVYYRAGSSGGGILANYNGTGANPEGPSPIDVPLTLDENPDINVVEFTIHNLPDGQIYYFVVTAYNNDVPPLESGPSNEENTSTTAPFIVGYPTISYATDTIDVTYSESNMQNATTETNYTFNPSLLFDQTVGGSDDISYVGTNTYQLSMRSIPANTIFTMTVSNITDQTGNPLTPNAVKVNDNDNDDMADDWEAATGVSVWSADPDSDALNNLEEYNNYTNPNNPDTDGDTLPDGWEVTYGLDPTDDTGANGATGDFDGDGWTNSEEYASGYNPGSSSSPAPTPPVITKSIPLNNSGITNQKRVPTNSSFAVYLQASEGIDITDTSSIQFTIYDGGNTYTRDLTNPSVFRVVKLTTDADDRVTKFWAVYDRSLDTYGNYAYDANVNIRVNAKDRRGQAMAQASFDFNVESASEQVAAQNNEPYTSTLMNSPSIGLITESIDSGPLAGAKVIYDSNEPVKPIFGPVNEVPVVGGVGITPAPSSYPLNLEPPTVFNKPVRIFLPFPDSSDASDPSDDVSNFSVALYDGENWVVACDANGNVLPAGDGWMVPGSRVNYNNGFPPSIELQVYHFSGVQAAVVTGGSSSLAAAGADGGGGGGGCFIATVGKDMDGQNILVLLLTFALALLCIVMARKYKASTS